MIYDKAIMLTLPCSILPRNLLGRLDYSPDIRAMTTRHVYVDNKEMIVVAAARLNSANVLP